MTPTAAEWVRAYVWPTELTRTGYRHERTCSCQWPCDCDSGRHVHCLTPDGAPAPDAVLAIVYGSRHTAYSLGTGLLHRQRVANVVHLPHQTPCRLLCRCKHTARPSSTPSAPAQQAPAAAPAVRRPRRVPAGQIGLFEEATTP